MDPEARHGSDHNGHGAVDRDWLRAEMHRLEISLHYWQARWHHTPGPSDPDRPRHRIHRVIDRLHRELALTLGLEPVLKACTTTSAKPYHEDRACLRRRKGRQG